MLTALLWQGYPLFREKKWKELSVFLTLFFLASIYSLGQVYSWPLPNPTKRLEIISEPAWKALEKILS